MKLSQMLNEKQTGRYTTCHTERFGTIYLIRCVDLMRFDDSFLDQSIEHLAEGTRVTHTLCTESEQGRIGDWAQYLP